MTARDHLPPTVGALARGTVIARVRWMRANDAVIEHARGATVEATAFAKVVLPTWYGAVTALDEGAVGQSAAAILAGWEELRRREIGLGHLTGASDRAGLAAHAAAGVGASEPAPMPVTANVDPAVIEAYRAIAAARRTIGNVVTLQDYGGVPVLGHYRELPVGPDPTVFILAQQHQATTVIGIASALVGILQTAKLDDNHKLDDGRSSVVADLLLQLDSHTAYQFVIHALRARGLEDRLYALAPKKDEKVVLGPGLQARIEPPPVSSGERIGAHHKSLLDRAAAGRDGIDATATPQLLAQMEKDAHELDEAVHALVVSEAHIDRILARYPDDRQRALFFKLLERRNLIDAVLHRGSEKHAALLHGTPGFERRSYNPDLNTSRSLGEQAGYIGAEMGRQTPGAVCQFASGVFKGLSHIPGIGPVFTRSAAAFAELSEQQDEYWEAWDDQTAKAWRNGVAQTAGQIDAYLLKKGAAGELGDAASFGATGMEAGEDALRIKAAADAVQVLGDAYHDANVFWRALTGSIDLIPGLLSAAISGDRLGEYEAIDGIFDVLIETIGGDVEGTVTDKGRAEATARADDRSGRDRHNAALDDLASYGREVGARTGPPTILEQAELAARGEAVKRAAIDNKARAARNENPEKGPPSPIKHKFYQMLRKWLIKLATAVLKLVKAAVMKTLKAQVSGPKPQRAPRTTGDAMLDAMQGNLPRLIATADEGLQGIVTFGLKTLLLASCPDLPEGVVASSLETLAKVASSELGVARLIKAPIATVCAGLAQVITSRLDVSEPSAHGLQT